MKVSAVLAKKGRDVKGVNPTTTVSTLAQRLRAEGVGSFVVLDDGRLAGIVSERDVVHAFAEHHGDAAELEVREIMTRNVVTCEPEDSLTRILGVMTQRRVRHLPVIENGQLAGLISIGDAVKYRLDELEMEASVLRDAYLAAH